ncbi:MAG: ATP-binding protein [Alphaproteobacteria bacterium]|nr:ATP-binding protein [Alphaproteobacteria bacterium]
MVTGADASLQAELRRQQTLLLTQQLPVMAGVNACNATLVSSLFLFGPMQVFAATWLAVLLIASALQLASWMKTRHREMPKFVSGNTLKRAQISSAVIGALWGVTSIFFWKSGDFFSQTIVIVVLGGMAAGVVSLLAPIPSVTRVMLATILTPLALRLVWEGEPIHWVILALLIVLCFALVKGAERSHRHMVELIRSAREMQGVQADLTDAIEATSDAIAHFDAEMNLLSANTRFNEWFKDPRAVAGDDGEGRMRAVGEGRWVVSKLLPTARGGFVSVHTDITELKQREDQIQTARLSAEEASRAKSAFIEQVGVTLRTPMEEVVAYLGSHTRASDERRAEIATHAVRVLEAVSDIADIATIDSQSYEYRFAFANVRGIVEWSAQAAAARYGKRRTAKLQINIHDEIEDLVCDERALKRTLMHLIVNALENTPEDKDVGVDVRKAYDGQAEICVWDFGAGFAPEHLERVQKMADGEEAPPSETVATQGIGLGLRIVSQVVQHHRGSLKILSEPTLGSFAYLKLPYRTSLYATPDALEPANDDAPEALLDRDNVASA